MKTQDFDLEEVTVKKDTVIIDFNTDSGTVNLQVSKESLLNHISDNGYHHSETQYNGDMQYSEANIETYLTENLREVVKSYLEENL